MLQLVVPKAYAMMVWPPETVLPYFAMSGSEPTMTSGSPSPPPPPLGSVTVSTPAPPSFGQ